MVCYPGITVGVENKLPPRSSRQTQGFERGLYQYFAGRLGEGRATAAFVYAEVRRDETSDSEGLTGTAHISGTILERDRNVEMPIMFGGYAGEGDEYQKVQFIIFVDKGRFLDRCSLRCNLETAFSRIDGNTGTIVRVDDSESDRTGATRKEAALGFHKRD